MFPKTCIHPWCAPPHDSLHVPEMLDGICSSEQHKHCLLVKKNKHWKEEVVQNEKSQSCILSSGCNSLETCTWTYTCFTQCLILNENGKEEYSECCIQSDKMIALKSNTWHLLFLSPNHPPTWVFLFHALTTESSAWTLLLKCGGSPGCLLLPFSSSVCQVVIFISANSKQLFNLTFFSWKCTIGPRQKYNVPNKKKRQS